MKPITSLADYLEMTRRHALQLDKIRKALKEFQGKCSHDQVEYEYDPAGGNDGYYYCLKCNKAL